MSEPPQYPPQYPPPPPQGPGGPGGPAGSGPGGPYGPGGSYGFDPYAAGPKPSSYLVWAILTTLFCCLPLGIVSIVQAAKVDGLWSSGNYAGARAASESAKKWALISAAVGVGLLVIWIVLAGVATSGGPSF
jgi:hypothetical protein